MIRVSAVAVSLSVSALLFSGLSAVRAEEPDWTASLNRSLLPHVGRGWAQNGRFIGYTAASPLLLDRRLRERKPDTWEEALAAYGPGWVSPLSGVGILEWHFDDEVVVRGGTHPISLDRPLDDPLERPTWSAEAPPRIRTIPGGNRRPVPEKTSPFEIARALKPEDAPVFIPVPLEGRFAAYFTRRPVVLAAKQRERMPKTFAETLEIFGPGWLDPAVTGGACRWWFDDGVECSLPGLPRHLADAVTWTIQPRPKTPSVVDLDRDPEGLAPLSGEQARAIGQGAAPRLGMREGRVVCYTGDAAIHPAALHARTPATYREALALLGPAHVEHGWQWKFDDQVTWNAEIPAKLEDKIDLREWKLEFPVQSTAPSGGQPVDPR